MNTIIFDLDGTLIDSAQDIALALKKTLEDTGLLHLMPGDVSRLIGGGVRALLERVLGDHFREEYVGIFRKHYFQNPVHHTRAYEGIPETLENLKSRYFDLIVGGDTFEEKKPSPLPVLKALERIGAKPFNALMVGDTDSDIISGRKAGTRTALALWGYTHSVKEKADFEFEEPAQILNLAEQVSGV